MMVIANLETRRVITYKAGDVMRFTVADLAMACAQRAEALSGAPHAVVHESDATAGLSREVAPWLQ